MKVGALVIIVTLPTKYAIELQLLGGVWILQTLPAIVVGLYTRWLHRGRSSPGGRSGMALGTLMAASQDFAPTYPLELFGTTINAYTGVFALAANLVVTLVADARPASRRRRGRRRRDAAPRTSTSSPRTTSIRRPAHRRPSRRHHSTQCESLAALLASSCSCRQARTR